MRLIKGQRPPVASKSIDAYRSRPERPPPIIRRKIPSYGAEFAVTEELDHPGRTGLF